jgi:hypothetical protein
MAFLKRRWLSVLVGPLTAVLCAPAASAQAVASENDIKAAFLYNFARYVVWPETAFADGDFRLCVAADRQFIASLDAIIAGESIEGRPVVRHTPATPEAAQSCHILFVGRGEPLAYRLFSSLEGKPVLLVGDAPDFLDQGGMVTFVREADRVRFDVDVTVAGQAGLTISSRLLRVARRVISPQPGTGVQ